MTMYHRNVVHAPANMSGWGDVGSFLKKIGGGAAGIISEHGKQQGIAQANKDALAAQIAANARRQTQQSFMDKYGLPIVLAGGGLALYFLVIKKKK